ncbi:MAG: hypothetical protein ABIL58_12405, partial [Pseudomonadota bacterium]
AGRRPHPPPRTLPPAARPCGGAPQGGGAVITTDIDRLHAAATGQITGRRCGKTFYKCHVLAAQIESGDSRHIVVMMTKCSDYGYLRPMIEGVLNEHGILFQWIHRYQMMCRGKIIHFMAGETDDGQRKINCLKATVVSMGHWNYREGAYMNKVYYRIFYDGITAKLHAGHKRQEVLERDALNKSIRHDHPRRVEILEDWRKEIRGFGLVAA